MGDGIKAVEMTPSEHIYTIELGSTQFVFKDKGVFGALEEGIDVVDFLPASCEGQACAEGDYIDPLTKDLYGSQIMKYVSSFRKDLPDMAREVKNDINKVFGVSINLNFNRWCERKSDRVPYAQQISLLHTDNLTHIQISDYSGDDKVDEALFTTKDGVSVYIRDFEYGLGTTIWDGSTEPCYNIDQSRYGLETFLSELDARFTKGFLREL